jgi:hypothetical protein
MDVSAPQATVTMPVRKRIALIAHDNCKAGLLDWARYNRDTLAEHELFATGTTGALLHSELNIPVTRFLSGPLGGDQLEPQPHDVDVKARRHGGNRPVRPPRDLRCPAVRSAGISSGIIGRHAPPLDSGQFRPESERHSSCGVLVERSSCSEQPSCPSC